MTHTKRRWSIILITALTLGVLSFALVGPGAAQFEYEQWLETAESRLRTQNGDCPPGQRCLELCLNMNGYPEPMGEFTCE